MYNKSSLSGAVNWLMKRNYESKGIILTPVSIHRFETCKHNTYRMARHVSRSNARKQLFAHSKFGERVIRYHFHFPFPKEVGHSKCDFEVVARGP